MVYAACGARTRDLNISLHIYTIHPKNDPMGTTHSGLVDPSPSQAGMPTARPSGQLITYYASMRTGHIIHTQKYVTQEY